MTEQPPRSWWSRNWKWIVPVGCLTPVVLCGGFISVILLVVFGAIKSATPYTESLARVKAHPQVQQEIGETVEAGFFVTGNIEVSGSSGNADISYSVSGEKGPATVYVVAAKEGGEWTYSKMEVQPDGGERIDLLSDP